MSTEEKVVNKLNFYNQKSPYTAWIWGVIMASGILVVAYNMFKFLMVGEFPIGKGYIQLIIFVLGYFIYNMFKMDMLLNLMKTQKSEVIKSITVFAENGEEVGDAGKLDWVTYIESIVSLRVAAYKLSVTVPMVICLFIGLAIKLKYGG